MVSLISFSIACLLLLSFLKRGTDILSPGRLFGLVWSVAIGLAELKLSWLQHEWSIESWLILLVGLLAFLLGCYVSYVLNLNSVLVPVKTIRSELRREFIYERRLFFLICFSFGAYVLSYLVIYVVKGFVPIFSIKGAISRGEFTLFGVGAVIHSMPFILYFIVLYHIVVEGRAARKWFLKGVALITAVTYFFLLQRFQFIMAMVMCFTLVYYATKVVKARTVVAFLVSIVAFFFWVSTIRTGKIIQFYIHTFSRMKYSYEYGFFTEPYMYLVMNLENMARAVAQASQLTYGYYTFNFIVALSGLKHWISDYFGLVHNPFLISTYNTYSAFWTFYRDFGTVGMLVVPLALGLLTGEVYYAMRRSPSLHRVSMYALLIFVMLISFFNYPLAFLWFTFNVVAVLLIMRFIVRRPPADAFGRLVAPRPETS